jgi:hypothetical protein
MKPTLVRLFTAFGACCALSISGAAQAETTVCDGGGAAGSGAGRISSVPFTISLPGVYCLTTKISSNLAAGTAIAINANNVVLDLNGYAIGNLAAGAGTSAVGIYAVDRQNIVVRNGILRGFWGGITLVNGTTVGLTTALSSGHRVEDITADTCYLTGIAVQGPFAIIRNNKVMKTKGSAVTTVTGLIDVATGISVAGADAYVANNVVLDTDCSNGCTSTASKAAVAIGIAMASTPSSVVENNTISNHVLPTVVSLGNNATAAAIYIFQLSSSAAGSTNVFVLYNQMVNWEYGIVYQGENATTTVASTGDFVTNGTQSVTIPYSGGTNVNLGNGMNF